MKWVLLIGFMFTALLCEGIHLFTLATRETYAEIILKNESGQLIRSASVDQGNTHIVVKNVPSGGESPRIMYDRSTTTYDTHFILDVQFADGSRLHENAFSVGGGEKITVVIRLHDANTVWRKAGV